MNNTIHSTTRSSLSKIEFFRKPEGAKASHAKTTVEWRGTDRSIHGGITSRDCRRDASRSIYSGMTSAYDAFPFLKK